LTEIDLNASFKPELVLICRVSPTFNISKQLESSLKRTLKTSVDSFEFWNAILVLVREGRAAVWWHATKKNAKAYKKHNEQIYESLSAQINNKNEQLIDSLEPIISTTLPVILKAGDPVGTMEIGIFNTNYHNAQYMLIKAVSLGRHMADIIQESLFQRQKDHHLRKMAVWMEMVNTISSTLDIRQVLHIVAQLTADLFSAKSCIYLLDEKEHTLIPAVAVGSYDPSLRKKFKALRGKKPFPAISRAIKTQQPVIVTPQNRAQLLSRDIIDDFNYDFMVLAPIISKDEAIGVMQVDRPLDSKKGFDHEETEIIFAIARATAIAIENSRLVEALGHKEQLLHQLVDKLITAQENERKRLASDLHDGIIQSLIAIWYRMQRITPAADESPQHWFDEIQDLTNVLGEQIQDIRRILYDLRPIILDNYGLIPAVESYLNNLQEQTQLQVSLVVNGNNQRLSSRIEITLFRILQEALTNVTKHAEATEVKVDLSIQEEEVALTVEDNGTGLDRNTLSPPTPQNHLGLASIQERALLLGGTCSIDSSKGEGTRILVKIPIEQGT